MKRNTEWNASDNRYYIINPDLKFPSIGELVQLIGYLEDLLEVKKEKNKDGK